MMDDTVKHLVLHAPGQHRLVWQDRVNGRWKTVHEVVLKSTLSRHRWNLVYRDAAGQVSVGQGSKTQLFNRMRQRVCDIPNLHS